VGACWQDGRASYSTRKWSVGRTIKIWIDQRRFGQGRNSLLGLIHGDSGYEAKSRHQKQLHTTADGWRVTMGSDCILVTRNSNNAIVTIVVFNTIIQYRYSLYNGEKAQITLSWVWQDGSRLLNRVTTTCKEFFLFMVHISTLPLLLCKVRNMAIRVNPFPLQIFVSFSVFAS